MGSSHSGKVRTTTAQTVEPVHYTENEAADVRAQARRDAERRFGTLGTNVTGGQATGQVLGGNNAARKRRTMGGE